MQGPWEQYGSPAPPAASAAAPPPIPRVIQGPPVNPPAGYQRTPSGLSAIPGGPADPSRSPPSGYRFRADGNLEAIPGGPADPDRNAGTLSGNRDLTGMEYAATIPDPARRAQAIALVEGRIPWPTGRASADPHWQQIIADASQIDPTLDAATSGRRRQAIMQFTGNGSAAQRIGSANRLANHLRDLYNASERLVGPDLGQSTLNSVVSTIGQSFEPADANTYDTAAGAVASELERYFRGAGGSTADIDRIIGNLSRHQSLETRRAAIREVVNLIHGAFTPLINQYNDAFQTGTARPQITWLDPGAQQTYRDLGGFDMGLPGAVAPGGGQNQPPVPPGGYTAADVRASVERARQERDQMGIPPGAPMPPQGPGGNGPQGGGPSPDGGTDEQGNLIVNVTGGHLPRNPSEADAGWLNAWQLARQRDPNLSFEQFMFSQRAHGSAPIADQNAANTVSNGIWDQMPIGGPLSQGVRGIWGQEAGDAARRGFVDVPTMGFSDEMSAGINAALGQGDYAGNVAANRAQIAADQENHPFARGFGQFAGSLTLPLSPEASLGRTMLMSGAYGGAYGLGSGEGNLIERAPNALMYAVPSALAPWAIRGGGRVLNALAGAAPASAERQALIEAAQRQNVDLMRADAGGVGTRMAAGVIRRTFGEIPMAQAARRSSASAGAAIDRVAADMGAVADPAGAGQAAQRGTRAWLETSRTRGDQIRNAIPIPADTPAAISGAVAALRERTAGMPSNQVLSDMFRDTRLEGYLAALEGRPAQIPTGVLDRQGQEIVRTVQEGGGLSWADLRRFRSLVGEMIDQPRVSGDNTSIGALRRLYAGLSQDMEATASQVSPRALTMVRRSIQYDRGRAARREGIISDILGSDFGGGAEAAFERINRWAQERGGNFANVAQTLRSMPAEEANSVRASIFARMGDATAARQDETGQVFSPAEFSRQWNQLSDRAKSFLIPDGRHRAALNDLALITARMKRATEYQNYSMTSLGANALGFLANFTSHPVAAVAYALGSYGAGRFLASAPAARWLSQAARMGTQQQLRSHIGRLASIAQRDPAIAPQAMALRNMLSGANDNFTPRAAASGPDQQQQPQ